MQISNTFLFYFIVLYKIDLKLILYNTIHYNNNGLYANNSRIYPKGTA